MNEERSTLIIAASSYVNMKQAQGARQLDKCCYIILESFWWSEVIPLIFVSTWGTRENSLLTEGYLLVCCVFMWAPWGWVLWWQDVFTSAKKIMTLSSGFLVRQVVTLLPGLVLTRLFSFEGQINFLSTRFLILILQWGLSRHSLEKLLLRLMSVSFVVESSKICPKLCNINLHNVTHSLISQNPRERMRVVQILLLIVTFLSLISRILSLMQSTKEVNPHPHITLCVTMWSVTFLFFFFFFFIPRVECWCMHVPHRLERPSGVDHTTPHHYNVALCIIPYYHMLH